METLLLKRNTEGGGWTPASGMYQVADQMLQQTAARESLEEVNLRCDINRLVYLCTWYEHEGGGAREDYATFLSY